MATQVSNCTIQGGCGTELTLPRVWQVGDSLCHDNGHVDASLDAIHAELDEDVVQNVFHDIPVAHYAGAGLERVADVSPGSGVGVAVLAGEGEGLVGFTVAVLGHDRGYRQPRLVLERPPCAHRRRACIAALARQ
jgi:hypothetical protein